MLFRGDDAVRKVCSVTGNLNSRPSGVETIVTPTGDLIMR